MGQVNVNPGSSDSGFGAGMIIGIILLILIVLVLIFYAGPQIFVAAPDDLRRRASCLSM
jgi:hypothetical protein